MPGNGDHGMGENFEKDVSGPSRVQRMYLGANIGRGVVPGSPLRMFITQNLTEASGGETVCGFVCYFFSFFVWVVWNGQMGTAKSVGQPSPGSECKWYVLCAWYEKGGGQRCVSVKLLLLTLLSFFDFSPVVRFPNKHQTIPSTPSTASSGIPSLPTYG